MNVGRIQTESAADQKGKKFGDEYFAVLDHIEVIVSRSVARWLSRYFEGCWRKKDRDEWTNGERNWKW